MEIGVNKKRPFCQDVGCKESHSPGMEAVTMILTKDFVPGNTIHEIRNQLEQLLQFVDKAAQNAVDLYDVERNVFDEVLNRA